MINGFGGFINHPFNYGLNEIISSECRYVKFAVLKLNKEESFDSDTMGYECLLVVLGGKCSIEINGKRFNKIGGRKNVFTGKPYSVYIPYNTKYVVMADCDVDVELAMCFAKSNYDTESYLIKPKEVCTVQRGEGNYRRKVNEILVKREGRSAQRLIVGETYTPSGNWSTYPPHKHDTDNYPYEVNQEEIYFHKILPDDGFGLVRHYDYTISNDLSYIVRNNTITCFIRGYHTFVGAPKYKHYYLWILAGEYREQLVSFER